MGNARPVLNYRRDFPNGDFIQVVIWLLPEPFPGSAHSFKYRLHYQAADGSDVIRYDNERGKGDHRHFEGKETRYDFENVRKLVRDFHEAVRLARKSGDIR